MSLSLLNVKFSVNTVLYHIIYLLRKQIEDGSKTNEQKDEILMVCSKSHTSPHVRFNASALILTRCSCPKSCTAFSHVGKVMTANTGIFTTCQEPDHTSYTE